MLAAGVAAGSLGLAVGCALLPPRSFLDPTQVGLPAWKEHDYSEVEIRRVLTARETPPGVANASEPTEEDLVPIFEDYRIGPQDVVSLSIEDFVGGNQPPYQANLEVSPTGFIHLPMLGNVKVLGLTEHELEAELKDRLRAAQLLTGEPVLSATISVRKNAIFNIMGSVFAPGPYQISQPDLRLFEALSIAHGISPDVRRFYVIRQVNPEKNNPPPSTNSPSNQPNPPSKPQSPTLPVPPPDSEGEFRSTQFSSWAKTGGRQEPPTSKPSADELELLLAPRRETPSTRASAPAAATPQSTPSPTPTERTAPPPIIMDPDTGKLREAPPRPAEPPLHELPNPVATSPAPPIIPKDFQWEIPEYELSQRVIEIDARALQAGEPRYNIIVRNRDVIQVPTDVGIFYMMGEVNRPGPFQFNGREITIKQAVAIAGGFSSLAWPARCEVIRREPGTDRQITIPVNLDAIFANMENDFILRDDDVVNVGSDVTAPFLFVIRNSFRLTYGFGFVYDRNYADVDSYGSRTNPEVLRQARRQQRGLPF